MKELFRQAIFANAELARTEQACPKCSERNPGNFEICFACGEELAIKIP